MENTKKPEIVMIGNEKGGTAKTATTLCLANGLTEFGYKVLIADFDPSGNLSAAALPDFPEYVLYDSLMGRKHPKEIVVHTPYGDVLPTSKDLAPEQNIPLPVVGMPERKSLGDLFSSLVSQSGAQLVVKTFLTHPAYADFFNQYDFILMDTQPSDSLIITNTILAADSIIWPCENVSGALDGLRMFQRSIQLACQSYGGTAKVDGLVFTKFKEDWEDRQEYTQHIQNFAKSNGLQMYNTRFRFCASIEKAINRCRPIICAEYMYQGWGTSDALNFTLEFLAKRGLTPRTEYPGVIKDEYGKLIFRRKGDEYFTLSMEGSTATVGVKRFRFEEVQSNAEQIGKTMFFHTESIQKIAENARSKGVTVLMTEQRLADFVQSAEKK